MYIDRYIEADLADKLLNTNKIVIIYGARQVGKTTLVQNILRSLDNLKIISVSSDQQIYYDILSSKSLEKLKLLIADNDILFIDEAQRIPDIGINLKIIYENFPQLKIIVTGSSSLDLAKKIKEPLTGRTWTFNLYPLALSEIKHLYNSVELGQSLEEFLIYGFYPDVYNLKNLKDKHTYLRELTSSYLYKDILELANIKNHKKLRDLLRLLAFQIGSQVSLQELGNNLDLSKDTVSNYIDLLEKSFVVFRLSGFSRNLRKEVTKMDKIYFYDLGVRNIIIENLNPLNFRDDSGKLWENFLISERKKKLEYSRVFANTFFWRTYTGAELDFVEEAGGILSGYEFKFNNKVAVAPKAWLNTYSNSKFKTINKDNYLEFIS